MNDWLTGLYTIGLIPLSWIYNGVTRIRNFLFDHQLIRSQSFHIPTICIGNLAVGGTGKTPHTELLIRYFLSQDYSFGVLSRGYGRKTRGFHWVALNSTADKVGDEPLQMRRKFTTDKVKFAVCEDRCKGITDILSQTTNLKLILLDDAFQHRRLKANCYILLTDYACTYDKDKVLPLGRLRESAIGKERANIIIVTKCPPALTLEEANTIITALSPKMDQTVFFTTVQYCVHDLPNKALLITGIANPRPLCQYLTSQGVDFKHLAFSDHHIFSSIDYQNICKISNNYSTILTTEKDMTRLEMLKLPPSVVSKIKIIPIVPHFLFDAEKHFFQLIKKYVQPDTRNCYLDSTTM